MIEVQLRVKFHPDTPQECQKTFTFQDTFRETEAVMETLRRHVVWDSHVNYVLRAIARDHPYVIVS